MAGGLKLYNTLTREKVDFEPIDQSHVRLYVCGPTVYDFAHIGNARPVIVFDVLYRLLRHVYGEAHVTYVRNITDVDDKINARALRDFPDLPLNEAIRAVTEKTESQFHSDVARLGCLKPTVEPRATDNIEQMKEIIVRLIDKGHAYVAAGEVLFDTKSMPDYGKLSKRNLDEQQAGARVAVDAHKKSPGDFVLWKLSSDNEPGWESPWGRGRPGWHIECSAMADRYLWEEIKDSLTPRGKTRPHQFDIHGGGLDLIFPHHENEIAQSCCANGTDVMANVWMHNGFVQVEGRKMSKSDGNFVTINELLDSETFGGRKWPGEVLRLAMLMTHYREPIDFSVKRLEEAERRLDKWNRAIGNLSLTHLRATPDSEFISIISNDLDTHNALSWLDRLSGYASNDEATAIRIAQAMVFLGILKDYSYYSDQLSKMIASAEDAAKYAAQSVTAGDLIDAENIVTFDILNSIIENRLALLAAKKFGDADKLRDELAAQGIQLKDGKDPITGERTTTWELKR